ncbi:mannonate dehydratase [Clostridium sp.]|uniref:mannonate dehydratase n=1 Tax=Clostridium sp. TaxID=1506 RepID=UPI0037C18F20
MKTVSFTRVRNIKHYGTDKFDEAAYLSSDGSLGMYEIMKVLYEIGFDGIVRPDYGRAIWKEVYVPGYGIYSRDFGVTYLNGILKSLRYK